MIELMCDCPELQDEHVFKIGDYVYDNGMMRIFSYGAGGDGPSGGGYTWGACADKLQKIPTKKELIHFAKIQERRKIKKWAARGDRYPGLEEDIVIRWVGGDYQFIIDWFSMDKFRTMMYWAKDLNDEGRISIKHKKKTQMGWWRHPYPPITYFYLWIPTQKQIQQMMMKRWGNVTDHYLRSEFYRWYKEVYLTKDVGKMTTDEAWVAFYMHRVASKIWYKNRRWAYNEEAWI